MGEYFLHGGEMDLRETPIEPVIVVGQETRPRDEQLTKSCQHGLELLFGKIIRAPDERSISLLQFLQGITSDMNLGSWIPMSEHFSMQ